jgi:hypothetical protein
MGGGGVQPSLSVGTTDRRPKRVVAAPATCRRHDAGAARPDGAADWPGERSASSAESGRAALAATEPASHPETPRSDAMRLFAVSHRPDCEQEPATALLATRLINRSQQCSHSTATTTYSQHF